MVGADYQEFLSETFCRTVPKKYVEESFSVSLFPGIEEIYAVERFVMILLSKFFCLTVPQKNFVWEHFCGSEFFWYRKILWTRM